MAKKSKASAETSNKSRKRKSPPSDPKSPRLYTLEVFLLSGPISEKFAKKNRVVSRTIQIRGDHRVDETTLDSLALKKDQAFGYWFDFGDDWWHQINVNAVESSVPAGRYPKITKREGHSPPQYMEEEE